jgi:hypothetical protein
MYTTGQTVLYHRFFWGRFSGFWKTKGTGETGTRRFSGF